MTNSNKFFIFNGNIAFVSLDSENISFEEEILLTSTNETILVDQAPNPKLAKMVYNALFQENHSFMVECGGEVTLNEEDITLSGFIIEPF